MIYILIFISLFINLFISPHLDLWGGREFLLPLLLLLLAAQGRWKAWLITFAGWGVLRYYMPISPLLVGLALATCGASAVIFMHFLDPENRLGSFLTLTGLLGLVIALVYFHDSHTIGWAVFGSMILSLPLMFIWFLLMPMGQKT